MVLWRLGFGLSMVGCFALVPDLSGVPMHVVGPIGHDLGPTIGQGHSVLALGDFQCLNLFSMRKSVTNPDILSWFSLLCLP